MHLYKQSIIIISAFPLGYQLRILCCISLHISVCENSSMHIARISHNNYKIIILARLVQYKSLELIWERGGRGGCIQEGEVVERGGTEEKGVDTHGSQ